MTTAKEIRDFLSDRGQTLHEEPETGRIPVRDKQNLVVGYVDSAPMKYHRTDRIQLRVLDDSGETVGGFGGPNPKNLITSVEESIRVLEWLRKRLQDGTDPLTD